LDRRVIKVAEIDKNVAYEKKSTLKIFKSIIESGGFNILKLKY